MKLLRQFNRKLSGFWVNGNRGKLLNLISFSLYMKKKTKHLKKLGVQVIGSPTYISPDSYFDSHDYSIIKIGQNVTISREVMLLTHDYSLSSVLNAIEDNSFTGVGEKTPHIVDGIEIGEWSFIGARASILPGTIIGKGCIVGACAVVKGVIPDYSIVVGNPGKIIGDTREYASRKMCEK